jgi:hypothetical protein
MTVNSFLLTGFVVSFVMVMFAMKYKVDKLQVLIGVYPSVALVSMSEIASRKSVERI